METNLMHHLSSVYFVNQPLHVSGIFVAHHQEKYSCYVLGFSVDSLLAGLWCNSVEVIQFHSNSANRQLTENHNTLQLLYIYSIPADDGRQICPKHVQDWRNKLRVNGASSWSSLHRCIEMHGQQNIKFIFIYLFIYMLLIIEQNRNDSPENYQSV